MDFKAVFLAAILCNLSIAGYNIKLYEADNCKGSIGHTCSNLAARKCCSNGGKTYQSAEFDEEGGSCSDQLKVYKEADCGGLAEAQETHPKCVRSSSKNVKGAQVFIVIDAKKRDLGEEIGRTEIVAPDESFYQNGTVRHVIKLDTAEGRAFMLLERDEDRIDHLVNFGRREAVVKKRAAPCKPKGNSPPKSNPPPKGGKVPKRAMF
jgi:hypothetical protein